MLCISVEFYVIATPELDNVCTAANFCPSRLTVSTLDVIDATAAVSLARPLSALR